MTDAAALHIVSHADCLDGMAAAWVVEWHYRQSRDPCDIFVHYQTYHTPLPEFPEGAHVVMVDFCPNDVNELKTLMQRAASLKIIDHHPKTEAVVKEMQSWMAAQNRRADFDSLFSRESSGALLAWNYFIGGTAPKLIQHISDHDLWQFRMPDTKEICAALAMFGSTTPAFEECVFIKNIRDLVATGETLLEAQRQYIDWTIQQTRCVFNAQQLVDGEVKDVYLLAVNGNHFIKNDVCARLEECYPGFAGYVCYWDLTDGRYRRYCVRSKEGNAQAIARCYGGQGHEGSAGFVLDRDSGLEVLIQADPDRPCPAC